jgi:sulfur carrier protein
MRLIINGEEKRLDGEAWTVEKALQAEKIANLDMVSVQWNQAFLDRAAWPMTDLKDGDELDFLFFMGGGSR